MNTRNDIQQELKSMNSILADMPYTMPFSVPDGYFENFPGSVKDIINDLNVSDITPEWSKTLPYTTPEGYFEELAPDLVVNAKVDELSKATPFSVPQGYFQSLPEKMLAVAKAADNTATETKIIPLKRRVLKQLRWAAAAVLILGIGLGSYRIFFNIQDTTGPETMLSSVPNTDIQDYLQHVYRMDMDRVVANNQVSDLNVDNKDIIQYLNETGWD